MNAYEAATLAVQAVASIAVVLTLIVVYRQMRTMDRQLRAMEGEMAARMRPWVGMFDFDFVPATTPATADVLKVLLRNSGTLPAQNARLTLRLFPTQSGNEPDDKPVEWMETGVKALVPGEEGNYGIQLTPYPQFSIWRHSGRDVMVEGTMNYALDDRHFQSKFVAALRFSEDPDSEGRVRTRWRNVEVV